MRLNPHCLEAVHFTAEFCIFEPYLSLLCYHTCKLCIHMGLHFHKCIGMGELMMDQTGIQTSAHWNSSMVLSYLALVVESVYFYPSLFLPTRYIWCYHCLFFSFCYIRISANLNLKTYWCVCLYKWIFQTVFMILI